MCFSIKLTATALKLENRYQVKANSSLLKFVGQEKFNGFDHPNLPIILQDSIELCRWGLIPHWVKDREQALQIQNQTLNARIETIEQKASFKVPIQSQRCIVPAHAFYETQHRGKERVPFILDPTQNEFFSLAAIWDSWLSPQTQTRVNTFSIVTTEANSIMAEIHNHKKRMPLILTPDQEQNWLNPNRNSIDLNKLSIPSSSDLISPTCLVNLLF
jgi:putative SOS response-associated peptidase YedK